MSLLLGALCACQLAVTAPDPNAGLTASQLVARARTARYQQDSVLSDYTAIARQRWTGAIGLAAMGGLGPLGRMRLAARFESVARMSWHHRHGAWAELIAARGVAPIAGEVEPGAMHDEMAFTIPYHPGRDRLWPMDEMIEALPGGVWIVHPLEAGSDSVYRFALGGPLTITLPDGRQIHLRELLVRPVRPDQRLIVGSLWLDLANGALVRAAYRPSVEIDLWPYMRPNFDEGDEAMIRKFGPFRGNVEEIVVEHGLYAGRFWLPRVRVAHAEGTAKGGRVTVSIEQTFEYERVNALARGVARAADSSEMDAEDDGHDNRWHGFNWRSGGIDDRPCRERGDLPTEPFPGDSLTRKTTFRTSTLEGVRLRVLLPCDRDELVNSPELPASIYSPSDELFTEVDLERVRKEATAALAISNQADWSPQPTTFRYGADDGLLRYNRIEALSAGIRAERMLGNGYMYDATLRLGVADLEPNGELLIRRSSGHSRLRAGAFRRLEVANDWGVPLGLSSSLGALLLGRDDHMYHRTLGVELGGATARITGRGAYSWRLFAERHDSASVGTSFSIARTIAGTDFAPNAAAVEGVFAGAAAAASFTFGLDPERTQFSAVFKGEGAGGELGYGRASAEFRLAQGLGDARSATLTAAGGSSVGTLPVQRGWYLGGAQTIHAHRVGAAVGDAFWMARAELTKGMPLIRPILFADAGWAGDRNAWNSTDRLFAAGIGMAALDGLLRFDLSRAMDASNRWSFDVFLEVR